MKQVLYGDPFNYVIIKYLYPIDLYNLCLTNKKFNMMLKNKIKKSIISEIENRLKNILDNFLEFQEFLNKSSSIISGSFIIQCILGEYWNNSDIDIYVPTKGNNI